MIIVICLKDSAAMSRVGQIDQELNVLKEKYKDVIESYHAEKNK